MTLAGRGRAADRAAVSRPAQIHFWDFSAYKSITYRALPNASIWHYICTLDFKTRFKFVMFSGIRENGGLGDVMPATVTVTVTVAGGGLGVLST